MGLLLGALSGLGSAMEDVGERYGRQDAAIDLEKARAQIENDAYASKLRITENLKREFEAQDEQKHADALTAAKNAYESRLSSIHQPDAATSSYFGDTSNAVSTTANPALKGNYNQNNGLLSNSDQSVKHWDDLPLSEQMIHAATYSMKSGDMKTFDQIVDRLNKMPKATDDYVLHETKGGDLISYNKRTGTYTTMMKGVGEVPDTEFKAYMAKFNNDPAKALEALRKDRLEQKDRNETDFERKVQLVAKADNITIEQATKKVLKLDQQGLKPRERKENSDIQSARERWDKLLQSDPLYKKYMEQGTMSEDKINPEHAKLFDRASRSLYATDDGETDTWLDHWNESSRFNKGKATSPPTRTQQRKPLGSFINNNPAGKYGL